ncbi:hypothetical protein NQ314_015685 [Rhamnusium bicolor]|uniref:Uncharacterized protein n=1 Tax=Rhamnusium bicolor TaxID=1586634 RepID=A0AAV8WY99_9CUCU|nr:hypothetical protein NQ314_015685 [Rhamnusium bicolor]
MIEEDAVEGETVLVRPIPVISHHSIMYAPKCLVLVSRLDYIETFRVSYLYIKFINLKKLVCSINALLDNFLS